MHRDVKNKKTLRALTLAISAALVMANTPITAFAADYVYEAQSGDSESLVDTDDKEKEVKEDTQEEVSTNVVTIPEFTGEASSIVENVVSDEEENGESLEEIFEVADKAMGVVQEEVVSDTDNEESLAEIWGDAKENVNDVISDMEQVGEDVETINSMNEKVESLTEIASNSASKLSDGISTYESSVKSIDDQIDEAKNNINDANASTSETEAPQKVEAASKILATAEGELLNINGLVEVVEGQATKAQEDYDAAKKQYDATVEEINALKEGLNETNQIATAAYNRLKAAETRLGYLAENVEALEAQKEQIEEIKEQYYAFIIQYYREVLGTKETVYNEKGELDIAANAEKITEAQINKKAISPSNELMYLGRDLLKKMVMFSISTDENVDVETMNISFGEEGNKTQKAVEGIVFDSSEGVNKNNDQVVTVKDRTNNKNEKLIHNDFTEYKWFITDQKDNGRTNRVKVTYTDKDGIEQTRYFNYVFKATGDNRDAENKAGLNFQNGPIFLGIINGEKGNLSVSEADTKYDVDNYLALQNLLDACDTINDYTSAKQAVSDAADKVKEIQDQITELQNKSISDATLQKLQLDLEKAYDVLESTTKEKERLQEKYDEAVELLAAAKDNLSRFDVITNNDIVAREIIENSIQESFDLINPADTMLISTNESVVAPTYVNVSNVQVPNNNDIVQNTVGVRENTLENNDGNKNDQIVENPKTTTIIDEKVPLAQIPIEEKQPISWWWLLIIFLLGATGRKMYEEYKERKEMEEIKEWYH